MKVIERPESTTVILEFLFHVIKDEKEIKNVMEGHTEDDLFIVSRVVDEISFQPKMYFALKEKNKSFNEWKKYVATMKLVEDTSGIVIP